MRRRPMILGLERQERVDRRDRRGIVAPDPDFASPGKRVSQVTNHGAPGGHHRGAGDRLRMHEAGKGEIAPGKPDRDVLHVSPDRGGPGGIDAVALQHDPPPFGQRLKHMRRAVLVHAHGDSAFAAVQRRGALGVVWYPDPYTPSRGYLSFGVDHADQVPWLTLAPRTIDGKEPTFAFILSLREGIALRNRLAAAEHPGDVTDQPAHAGCDAPNRGAELQRRGPETPRRNP